MYLKILFIYLFCFVQIIEAFSQSENEYIVVSGIGINGNKKTKSRIIIRELDIAFGDTILKKDIEEKLLKNKNKITNLDLFLNVELKFECISEPFADLHITVIEQSFYYPVPVLLLADRSFNEWWYNRNHDLRRLIYGVNLVHFNIGGRAEQMMINLETGFSKRAEIHYRIPYLNRAMKTGLDLDFRLYSAKQLPYKTNLDKQIFESSNNKEIFLKRISSKIGLRRRNSFYVRQRLELSFNHESLNDTIAKLNPNYFLFGKTKLDYFRTTYEYTIDHRDNFIYPSKGHYFIARASRVDFLGSKKYNQNELYLSFAFFEKFGQKWFGDINLRTKISSPSLQAWATSTAFGYRNDNVRGYDLYVIDGQKTALFKSNFRREFFNTSIKMPETGLIKKQENKPLVIYGRLFYDAGYVSNVKYQLNNSKLANTFIYGYGFGFDIVSIYTGALKINFSVNKQKETGLFFSYGREF